jgi:hypothetical protein
MIMKTFIVLLILITIPNFVLGAPNIEPPVQSLSSSLPITPTTIDDCDYDRHNQLTANIWFISVMGLFGVTIFRGVKND